MKTIVNKVVKALKNLNGNLYKIVERYDDNDNKEYLIQDCHDFHHITNPMDNDVNFDFENDYDPLLTWKETGKRLTEEEYKTYFDSTIFTKKSEDELKYEDLMVVYKDVHQGENFVQISGLGYLGTHYTYSQADYSESHLFVTEVSKLLPNKDVYEDDGRVGIWNK